MKKLRLYTVWAFLLLFTFLTAGPLLIPLAVSLIVSAVSIGVGLLINALTPSQAQDSGQMTSMPLQGSDYGQYIPRIWGDRRIAPNVIWTAQSFTDHVTTTSTGSGGKGGGPSAQQTNNHTYSISFATEFCQGPIKATGGLINLWADTRLIYSGAAGQIPHQGQVTTPDTTFTVYYGYEDGTDGNPSQDINTEMQAEVDGRLGVGSTSAHRGMVYIFFHEFMITPYGNRIPSITAEFDEGTHDLGVICTQLYESVGLTAAEIDMSEITGITIPGCALDDTTTTVSDVLQGLMNIYNFELPEPGGIVKAKLLAAAPTFTIPFSDLAAFTGSSQRPIPIEATRVKETDLPKTVSITYIDPDRDFQQCSQSYTDITLRSTNITTYQINLVVEDDQALNSATIRQQEAILARDQYVFAVPYKYAALAPADKGFITDETGALIQVKLTQIQGSVPGALTMQAVRYDASVYTQVGIGDPGSFHQRLPGSFPLGTGGGGGGGVPFDGSPGYKIIEPDPDLGDAFQAVGHTSADSAVTGVYAHMKVAGRLMVETVSGSGNYSAFADFPLPSTNGVTVDALGATSTPNTWDLVNTVTIQMSDQSAGLVSVPPNDLILDDTCNKILFANGEYVQFANATPIYDDTLVPRGLGEPIMYQISTLLRGRHGSDYAVGTHIAGETAVMVDAALRYVQHDDKLLGKTLNTKFVGFGMTADNVTAVPVTLSGTTQKPLSPVHITGNRDLSSNLTINWTRRSRNPSTIRRRTNIPIAEQNEEYEIDILDDGTASTVVFQNIVGAGASGNSIQKTAGNGWGNCGATSIQSFGGDDGKLNATVQCFPTEYPIPGTLGLTAFGFTSLSTVNTYTQIDYCLQIQSGQITPGAHVFTLAMYEFGVLVHSSTLSIAEETYITIKNGFIYYYTDSTGIGHPLYAHPVSPSLPLRLGVAIFQNGAELDLMKLTRLDAPLRTITVTATQASYTAAQQQADFGFAKLVIPITMYQISATTNRGFPASVTI